MSYIKAFSYAPRAVVLALAYIYEQSRNAPGQ